MLHIYIAFAFRDVLKPAEYVWRLYADILPFVACFGFSGQALLCSPVACNWKWPWTPHALASVSQVLLDGQPPSQLIIPLSWGTRVFFTFWWLLVEEWGLWLIPLKSWGTAVDKRKVRTKPWTLLFVWEPSCSDYTGLDVLRYQQGTGRCFCWGCGSQPAVSPRGNWPLSLTQSHLNILNLLTLVSHAHSYHSLVLKNLFFDHFMYVYCIFIMVGIIPILRHT